MKFKVGDVVKVIRSTPFDGINGIKKGMVGTIIRIDDSEYPYCLDINQERHMGEWQLKLINKTMNDLQAGDIIVTNLGEKSKIIVRLGNLVARSYINDHDSFICWKTIKDLENEGWKLHTEEEIEELTVEEVSKRLGKTVKIVK